MTIAIAPETRTCILCRGTRFIVHPDWHAWQVLVGLYELERTVSKNVQAMLDKIRPQVPTMMPCEACNNEIHGPRLVPVTGRRRRRASSDLQTTAARE